MEDKQTIFADRSARAKLEVTGPQRLWFLHQVLTQAFEDLEPGVARDACLITVHGRMQAYMEAIATHRAVLLHYESDLRQRVPETLERYVFATQVELRDVTDDKGLVLVVGSEVDGLIGALGGDVTVHPTRALGLPASYLWCRRDDLGEIIRVVEGNGAQAVTEDHLESLRIEHGRARWGFEMDEKTFPQEAGVDGVAVHYDKGCYLGQEAMAKIHFRGKVNRRLVRLEAATHLARGSAVTLEGAKAGTVTSVSDGRGLALVRHTVQAGAAVEVDGANATVLS